MEELIRKVIATLNAVEVKGKDNIDRMLGCILALEKVADAMKHNREEMGKTMPDERSEER